MADLFKPLFNASILRARLGKFTPELNADQSAIINAWVSTVADPAFRLENEKPHQGQFLADVFVRLLGYTPAVGHLEAYHLKAESASTETKGGRTPDVRLGSFGPNLDCTPVVSELKAPAASLDVAQRSYGNLSLVLCSSAQVAPT